MRYLIWLLLVLLVVIRQVTTRSSYSDGDKIRITSKVTSEPIRYETSQQVSLQGLKTYLPLYPDIHYGDRVVVEGVVAAGPKGLWPGGMNYKLNSPTLIDLQESQGILYKLRSSLVKIYESSLPEPHAALVAGITLGSKASLPTGFWEALKKTGTAHVVVASGMNVTMTASFLMGLFILFLPRRKAIPLAFLGIWIYSLLSGF